MFQYAPSTQEKCWKHSNDSFNFLLKNHSSCGIEVFHIRQSLEKQKVTSLTLNVYMLVSQTFNFWFSKNKWQFLNSHRKRGDLQCALEKSTVIFHK
jgi:hypothetical protein